MGFGTLLFGYFLAFAFSVSPTYFFSDVIGTMVMAYAFTKLSVHARNFKKAAISSAVYSVYSAVYAVLHFTVPDKLSTVVFESINISFSIAGLFAIHFFMCAGIIELTNSIGLNKIASKARRNLGIFITYIMFYIFILVFGGYIDSGFPEFMKYVYLFNYVFMYLWLLLNIILICSCMKWIGLEGEDEYDPEKATRLQKISHKIDEIHERAFTPKDKRKISDDTTTEKRHSKRD